VTLEIKNPRPPEGMTAEESIELARKIMVIVPYRQQDGIQPGVCMNFSQWGRVDLLHAAIKDPNGGFLEVHRGGIIRLFMEYVEKFPHLKYLMMIDNDEIVDWDVPLRLARHDLPVVSGVVCGYNPERGVFACFTATDENGTPRFPSFNETKTMPSKGVIKVHQVGAGLLCIRRDVIETLLQNDEVPFMLPPDIHEKSCRDGNLYMGEDIVFAERCRKYGFDVYVDLSVHAGHVKSLTINWPVSAIDPSTDAINWKVSKFDYKGVV